MFRDSLLEGVKAITPEALIAENAGTDRLVRKAELIVNRVRPAEDGEMSHYAPALWLIGNQSVLEGDAPEVAETLDHFEKVCAAFNALL